MATMTLAESSTTLIEGPYKDALDVQNACNPNGVVRAFRDAFDAIGADLDSAAINSPYPLVNSTDCRRFHPITVLYASKIHDLCGLGLSDSNRFALACDFATRASDGRLAIGSDEYYRDLNAYYIAFKAVNQL